MHKCAVAFLSTLLVSSMTSGQSVEGYGFIAPGQMRIEGHGATGFHFGGGGRYIGSTGLGLGAELGIAGPKKNFGDF